MTPSRQAFTLIELLIVIAIIGILMSLLFPAVNGAIDAARKAQAKNDIVQIATAVTAYETEYGRLPNTNSGAQTVSGDWVLALGGSNVGNLNPRQIVFLEIQTAKKGKGGTNASGQFVDPWGGTYQVMFDDDYNNRLSASVPRITGSGNETVDVMKKVILWNTNSNTRRLVRSWE